MTTISPKVRTDERTARAGILVMMCTSFVLVVSEFLPPSMLPAMAESLRVTEGQAGQAVTVTALVGFLVAPTIGLMLPHLDRRLLLSGLALAAVISNVLVAITPTLWLLLVARLLLGAAIGGFWAMSLAVASRLTSPERLGRSMMLINTGTTVATVAGVPLGIYLGSLFDWRLVFGGAAAVAALVSVALVVVLPPIEPAPSAGLRSLAGVLRVRGIAWGLTGHVLVVLGHFAAFSYVRPALHRVDGLDDSGAAIILVVFGIGSVAGNFAAGMMVDRHLAVLRYVIPLGIAVGIGVLVAFPYVIVAGIAAAGWGFVFGAWLSVVTTWMGKIVPDRMEAGGGLLVAGFQLAIMIGAGVGGVLVDAIGAGGALTIAAVAAVLGGLVFGSAPTGQGSPVGEETIVVAAPERDPVSA